MNPGATSVGLMVLAWIIAFVMVVIAAGKCAQSTGSWGFLSLIISPWLAGLLFMLWANKTEQGRARTWSASKARGILSVVLALSAASFIGASALPAHLRSGFTDEDIANVKKTIKEKFEEQPGDYRVTDIEMMRETSTKLTGFATVKVNDSIDITKMCNAVYGDGKYIWRCQ